jgi:hypothetical protein
VYFFQLFLSTDPANSKRRLMSKACSIAMLSGRAKNQSALILVVGLILGLAAFSSNALQLIGCLRAAQNETSESRTEYETHERIHAAVLQARNAKTRSGFIDHQQSAIEAADIKHSVRRALAESRCRAPAVVFWSPAMRC